MRKDSSRSKPMKRSKKDASSEEDQIESLEYENPGDDKIEEDEDVIYHSGIASEKLREDLRISS